MILMDGMMVGVSRLMVDSLTDTLEGEAQIYHQGFRERFDPSLYLDNTAPLREVLALDQDVRAFSERDDSRHVGVELRDARRHDLWH